MSYYRKKPVVIEARQLTAENLREIAAWANGAVIRTQAFVPFVEIQTLEGRMIGDPGDWIIKGVKGEFYPCKPDVFEQTYEPVEGPS